MDGFVGSPIDKIRKKFLCGLLNSPLIIIINRQKYQLCKFTKKGQRPVLMNNY